LLTDVFALLIVVLGLAVFETVSSVDNAVINADVLSTMGQRARRWFLLWGLLISVFAVRGLLPWLIVWGATPDLGPLGALTATFSDDPHVVESIERSAPVLFAGAGVFLVLLFVHWLFLEPKHYGLIGERFFHAQAPWFFTAASVILALIVWFALRRDPLMAFGAVLGSTAFFITHGFKQYMEQGEKELIATGGSDVSKVFYLSVIDATFSIDGVLGAFAFTLSVPLILLGNGLGAIVVRQMTVSNIERIKRYRYLKNGAMYSIFCLGAVMVGESFGMEVPVWIPPLITFGVLGFFFYRSWVLVRAEAEEEEDATIGRREGE